MVFQYNFCLFRNENDLTLEGQITPSWLHVLVDTSRPKFKPPDFFNKIARNYDTISEALNGESGKEESSFWYRRLAEKAYQKAQDIPSAAETTKRRAAVISP